MKSFLVGGGGREAALGMRLAESSRVHVLMPHPNPTLVEVAERSGGGYTLGDPSDPALARETALRSGADFALVSSDSPLEAGVVDRLLEAGVPTVGPTRAGAEVEWNKALSRALVAEVAPEANPAHFVATTVEEAERAFREMGSTPVVVKPGGLTAGKGVKVMGAHLADHAEAAAYARELIQGRRFGGIAIVEERIDAPEFTIQAITDGTSFVFPPATYDYPFRFEGDTGPGTGGMGCFVGPARALPFIRESSYDAACEIIRRVVRRLGEQGRRFNGVMNAGFFATPDGPKVIEFNARFGDPECINIMALLESDLCGVAESILGERLDAEAVRIAEAASVVVYLVSPDYAIRGATVNYPFEVDVHGVRDDGCEVLFSAAVRDGRGFRTHGNSRSAAVSATGATLEEARERAYAAIGAHVRGPLEYRGDIAGQAYVAGLVERYGSG